MNDNESDRPVSHVPTPDQTGEHAPAPETLPQGPLPPTASFDSQHTTGFAPAGEVSDAGDVPGYELLGELGRGGMGVVYEARDTRLNRAVALKMVLGRPGTAELMRFRAEAEAMAAVRHPNVAQVLGAGESDGRPFLVMELLPGGTLEEYLRADRGRPPAALAEIVRKVAAGVAAAHAQGIVHRDLKPGNVLFDGDGVPKVTDFGLAKRGADGPTATGAVMGTPAYMAPEQAGGNTKFVGPEADVWSLGVILYQALTGARPFAAADTRGVLAQVLTADPVPPRRLAPGVPRDLELVCLKCLAKAAHERYPTAKELADDLGRFARGEPISVRPIGRARRAARWVRRHPAEAGLLAAASVAVLALVGFGVALAYQGRLEDANRGLASSNGQLEDAKAQLERVNGELVSRNGELSATQAKLEDANKGLTALSGRLDEVLYFRRVGLALEVLRGNDPVRARRFLAECPEKFRGWEWRYVNRLLDPRHPSIQTGKVGPLAYSPDGKILAAACADGVKLFDVGTSEEIRTLKGAPDTRRLVFSRDGKLLATVAGKTVTLWDVATGKELHTLPEHPNGVLCVAFSWDGKRLATGENRDVRLWDTASGKKLNQFAPNGGSPVAMTFNPAGTLLVAATAGTSLEMLDPTRKAPAPSDPGTFLGPDAARETGRVSLPSRADDLTFTPDGRRLVAALYNGTVWIRELNSPRQPVTIKGHAAPVTNVVFGRDGTRFGTISRDGMAKVWDATTYQEIAAVRVTSGVEPPAVMGMAFAPELFRVAAGHADGSVKFWPVTKDFGAALSLQTGTVYHAAFNADGSRFAAAVFQGVRQNGDMYGIRGWDTATGRMVMNVLDQEPWHFILESRIAGFAFDPAGERVATAHVSGRPDLPKNSMDLGRHAVNLVQVWDAATGKRTLAIRGHYSEGVLAVAFCAGGKRIAGASGDGSVNIWDAADGRLVTTFSVGKGQFLGPRFSRDGRRLAGLAEDGTLRLWDVEAGKEVVAFKGSTGRFQTLALSADGRRILTGGEDKTVRVWDDAGRELLACVGHVGAVTALAISPEGTRLASGDLTGVVKLWDAATGQETLSAPAITYANDQAIINGLEFSPDGTRLLITGSTTVRLWDARGPTESER